MLRIILLSLLLGSTLSWADEPPANTTDDPSEPVALNDLPKVVRSSAKSAKPDVYFKSAERMWLEDNLVYRVSGVLFREQWDVYVRADGVVIRTTKNNMDD